VDADVAERVALDGEPECEGFERFDRGDVRYKVAVHDGDPAMLPSPWSSGVEYARWRPGEIEQKADELIRLFKGKGVPFTWSIGPNTDAPGLAAVLSQRGLRKEVDALILTAKIPIRGRLPLHDLRLAEEHDERTASDALRIDRHLVGEALQARVEKRLTYLRCPTRRGGGVIAYRRDLAVGYAAWRYGSDGDTVFLHGAHTLRPHRRTGVYTAILGWRLDRAVRDGKTTAVVTAERSSSAPILMRKGFREVGALQVWVAAGTR